jgi:hypothetical protein
VRRVTIERGIFRFVTRSNPDEEGIRGMGRWAVRFSGSLPADALAALKERRIETQPLDHFLRERLAAPSTTVAVQAAGGDDAIHRVREGLDGHGEFSCFEATPFVEQA